MQTETVFHPTICVGGSKTNPIHILHVDDDSSALEIFKLMLLDIDARFEIDNACCVDEGLNKLANGHYDVVVSDYEMPQKSGLQFLKELREQNNEIPFILFTGKGREEVAIKALNLGADGYHNKQGSPETVYGELAHSINLTVDRRKAKLALSESERRYRALMEKASDAIFIHDVEGRIIDANQRACNSLGYSNEELLEMGIGDIDTEVNQAGKDGLMWSKVIAGESFVFEANQKRKDGSVFPVEVSLGPIKFGDITFIMGLVRDITERKKNEEELKQKYDVLERVGENVGAGLAIIAKDYSIIWANKTLRDIMVDRNKKCYQIFNKLSNVCPDCGVKKIFEQNVPFETHEYETVDSKGEKTWIELRVTPLKDKNGATMAALELAIPITERKRAEAALKESEAKHRDLADSLPEIVFETDLKGNLTYTNNNAFIITGYTKQDFAKGIYIFDLIEQKDKEKAKESFKNTLTNKPTDQNEFTLVKKDGGTLLVEVLSKPIVVENRTVGLRGILLDITHRKKTEEVLLASEEKYHAIFESTGTATVIIEEDTTLSLVNTKFEELSGYSKEELEGKKSWTEFVVKEDLDRMKELHRLRRIDEKAASIHYNFRFMNRYGEIKNIFLTVAIIPGTKKSVASLLDVTESKKTKRDLQESEERYRSLFEQAPLPVTITDLDGTMLEANIAMQSFTGYSLKELKKTNVASFYQNPQDRKKLIEIFEREGVISDFYTQLKIKNNNFVDVVLNVSKFQIGKKSFLRTTIQDVSDRVKAEETLNQIMDQLVLVNEKLGVVGSLTRHDVRNKLSTVSAYAYLLKKKHADMADIVDGLSTMEQAVRDSMQIFDFAKMYEQLGSEDLVLTNVSSKLNEATALFSGELPKIINGCHELTILADSFLRQLFYNFIDNTRKYGKKTSYIRVYCEKMSTGDLQLVYEDDGVGISAENKSKLFSEGFSTGSSTGFGLFLIKKMMDVYGWTIQETGEPGKGARFVIIIPEKNKFGKANYQVLG